MPIPPIGPPPPPPLPGDAASAGDAQPAAKPAASSTNTPAAAASPATNPERQLALQALAGALQGAPPDLAPVSVLEALAARLSALMPAWPGHADLARLIERAEPLPLDADTRTLVAVLRRLVNDALPGLEAALRDGRVPPEGGRRTLLARVLAAIPPEANGALAALGTELRARLEGALREPVANAWHHTTDGRVRVDVPVQWPTAEGTVELVVDPEADDGAGPRGRTGASISLFLEVPDLGPVEAYAEVAPERVAVRLYVAHERTGGLLTALQPAFEERLRAAGFAAAAVAIVVNPARLAAHPSTVAAPAPAGGSLLDVRA